MNDEIKDVKEEVINESNNSSINEPSQPKNTKKKNVILIVIASVLIIGLIGAGVWYYINKNTNNNSNNNTDNNNNNNTDDDQAAANQTLKFNTDSIYTSLANPYGGSLYDYLVYTNIKREDITLSNSNDSVITLNNGEFINPVAKGESIVTAKYKNLTAQIKITIADKTYTNDISIAKKVYSLYVGENLDVKYNYYPKEANSFDLNWSTSDNKIVTMSNGKITGVKVGKATITLKDNSNECEEQFIEGCSDTSTAYVYVVNSKMSYEVKENNTYKTIDELVDKTSVEKEGISYTASYRIRLHLTSQRSISYNQSDIDIQTANKGGSKVTLEYFGVDNSCDNCYLYDITYSFDHDKADLENSSTITATLPDGSASMLEVYTDGAYSCYNACKPVLYLYPEHKTSVTVSLTHPEYIVTSYPKYNNNWSVTAMPNGNIYDKNGRSYYALYWDEKYYVSKENSIDFSTGFYVNKNTASSFLEDKLDIIGLNEREANELIMYWLPVLEKNEHSLVYFELTNEREKNNKININPKPDSLLRVLIHIKKVNTKVAIKPETLTTFKRVGFTAVEWGGVQH